MTEIMQRLKARFEEIHPGQRAETFLLNMVSGIGELHTNLYMPNSDMKLIVGMLFHDLLGYCSMSNVDLFEAMQEVIKDTLNLGTIGGLEKN